MTNDRLGAIEHTLQQLVAGQTEFREAVTGRLDGIDARLVTVDRRLDTLESGQNALRAKVDTFTEAQAVFEQTMGRRFDNLREEFDRRLVPLETAVRRISAADPAQNGGPPSPRKRTPRR